MSYAAVAGRQEARILVYFPLAGAGTPRSSGTRSLPLLCHMPRFIGHSSHHASALEG